MNIYEEAAILAIEAAERFGGSHLILNKRRVLELKLIMSHIEHLANEFDGDSVDMQVDEDNRVLKLSVEISELVCQSEGDEFVHELVSMVDGVSFSKSKDGNLKIDFVIDGLWRR